MDRLVNMLTQKYHTIDISGPLHLLWIFGEIYTSPDAKNTQLEMLLYI